MTTLEACVVLATICYLANTIMKLAEFVIGMEVISVTKDKLEELIRDLK